jgi:large subunit ribosomal protein L22
VSNLQNKDEGGRVDPEDMTVKEAFVDVGMTMKRISPAPMGRAYRIRKRSNHVTIVVAAEAKKVKAKPKPTPAPASAAKTTRKKKTTKAAKAAKNS